MPLLVVLNEYRDFPLCCCCLLLRAVSVVMLLSIAAGVVVSVAIEAIFFLVYWYKHNGIQYCPPLFVMVGMRVPLRAAFVLSLLLLLLSTTAILSLLPLLALLL